MLMTKWGDGWEGSLMGGDVELEGRGRGRGVGSSFVLDLWLGVGMVCGP